jgi:hypothetical protein
VVLQKLEAYNEACSDPVVLNRSGHLQVQIAAVRVRVRVGPETPVFQSSEYHEFVTCRCQWRGEFENFEVTALHSDAFEVGVVVANETDWQTLLAKHSLGWVTARDRDQLLGFVNVIWDG